MVSRRYISAWGNEKGHIDVIDIQRNCGYTTTAERATIVSYVYETAILEQENLEAQFAKIETAGTPALVKLREEKPIDRPSRQDVIAFLDMHLERGRYADQARVTTQAVAVRVDGAAENVDLQLADRMILSRYMKGAERLAGQGLDDWQWAVCSLHSGARLVTGDGAVIRWAESKGSDELGTVTFPLSPTQLLVIGRDLPEELPINDILVSRCRRWIVGEVDTLSKDPAVLEAASWPPPRSVRSER